MNEVVICHLYLRQMRIKVLSITSMYINTKYAHVKSS